MNAIIVVGAGPGGLATGLALQRVGFDVEIWERGEQLRTAGAGLTLQINAMRMLAELGVADALEQRGTTLKTASLADHRGRVLQNIDFGPFAARYGRAGVGIHRGLLSQTLADALDPGTITFGRALRSVETIGDAVRAHDDAGDSADADAVIGADGIHSVVRTMVLGKIPLRYAGYTCWRGIAAALPEGPGHMVERWGPGRRFGCVPIDDATTYWFATENTERDGRDGCDPRAQMLARFADFSGGVRAVLAGTPNAAILRNDIIDFAPLDRWTRGRVGLVGDAAHAMTPNLGQGACQAIEDAVVLAANLREHGLDEGLARYEAVRRPRARSFVVRSWRFGATGQLRNRAFRWLRDRAVGLLSGERAVRRQLDAIYGVEVPRLGTD